MRCHTIVTRSWIKRLQTAYLCITVLVDKVQNLPSQAEVHCSLTCFAWTTILGKLPSRSLGPTSSVAAAFDQCACMQFGPAKEWTKAVFAIKANHANKIHRANAVSVHSLSLCFAYIHDVAQLLIIKLCGVAAQSTWLRSMTRLALWHSGRLGALW